MDSQTTPNTGGLKLAQRVGFSVVLMMLVGLALTGWGEQPQTASARNETIGSQFVQLWQHADKPVQDGRVSRSYVWGPSISGVITEPYAEGSSRQVQYFDKTRMEQTAGRNISNGLLVKELITGLEQLGDNKFQQYAANAVINIAGDQGASLPNPTYASFRKVATIDPKENRTTDTKGQLVTATLSRNGTVGSQTNLSGYNVRNQYFVTDSGHNIPNVLWDFLNQRGLIYDNGAYTNGRVFDWVVAMGLPLTEAYWTRSVVAGKEQDVLVQAFERRVLTYTPANPSGFQVEMGNVGQHYYQWRQALTAQIPTGTPTAKPTTGTPTPKPTVNTTPTTTPAGTPTVAPIETPVPTTVPVSTVAPTAPAQPTVPAPTVGPIKPTGSLSSTPAWQGATVMGGSSVMQPLFLPAMKVRPDGVAFLLGESGSGTGAGGYPGNALLLGRSDSPTRFQSIDDSPAPTGQQTPNLAFAPNGTGYVVYRYFPSNYRAWLRTINPDGSLQPGFDIGHTYRVDGGAGDLDFPDVAYAGNTLYLVGEIQTSATKNGIGFGESTDGGHTWKNIYTFASNVNPRGQASAAHICVDGQSNLHVLYYNNSSVYTQSRINGQWGSAVQVANGSNFLYRGDSSIACGADGYAYAVWDGPNSFGLARYTPGAGWRTVTTDAFPAYDSRSFRATVTPDGRLWIAEGYFPGRAANPAEASLLVSLDRGQSFLAPQRVVSGSNQYSQGVGIAYSPANGHLYFMTTFMSPRESLFTVTR